MNQRASSEAAISNAEKNNKIDHIGVILGRQLQTDNPALPRGDGREIDITSG